MFYKKKSLWLFLLPGLLGLMLFYVVPFLGGIYFSMTDGTIANRIVWFDNYQRVWDNEVFRLGLKNSLELSLISAPLIFVFSFVLAVMLRALKEKSVGFRNLLLMPYLVPSAALLIVWQILFDYGGAVNRAAAALGFERVLWLESEALRVPVVLYTYGRTWASPSCCFRRRCLQCRTPCTSLPGWRVPALCSRR